MGSLSLSWNRANDEVSGSCISRPCLRILHSAGCRLRYPCSSRRPSCSPCTCCPPSQCSPSSCSFFSCPGRGPRLPKPRPNCSCYSFRTRSCLSFSVCPSCCVSTRSPPSSCCCCSSCPSPCSSSCCSPCSSCPCHPLSSLQPVPCSG